MIKKGKFKKDKNGIVCKWFRLRAFKLPVRVIWDYDKEIRNSVKRLAYCNRIYQWRELYANIFVHLMLIPANFALLVLPF